MVIRYVSKNMIYARDNGRNRLNFPCEKKGRSEILEWFESILKTYNLFVEKNYELSRLFWMKLKFEIISVQFGAIVYDKIEFRLLLKILVNVSASGLR